MIGNPEMQKKIPQKNYGFHGFEENRYVFHGFSLQIRQRKNGFRKSWILLVLTALLHHLLTFIRAPGHMLGGGGAPEQAHRCAEERAHCGGSPAVAGT
jgi:hypothetical protein